MMEMDDPEVYDTLQILGDLIRDRKVSFTCKGKITCEVTKMAIFQEGINLIGEEIVK
jgi:hypothetical protein